MTEATDNLLEPKTNRSPEEVGRAIFRYLERYDALRVEPGESEYDVKIYPHED